MPNFVMLGKSFNSISLANTDGEVSVYRAPADAAKKQAYNGTDYFTHSVRHTRKRRVRAHKLTLNLPIYGPEENGVATIIGWDRATVLVDTAENVPAAASRRSDLCVGLAAMFASGSAVRVAIEQGVNVHS